MEGLWGFDDRSLGFSDALVPVSRGAWAVTLISGWTALGP